MTTLLDKVTLMVSANLHALVDDALRTHSLAVIDQYLRQVEDQLRNLEDAAATVGAEVKGLHRKLAEHQARAAELNRAVDVFLIQGNEAGAAATQTRLNGAQQLIDNYQAQHARHEAEYQQLREARSRLEARHAALKQHRAELQALMDLTRGKEGLAQALHSLDAARGAGDGEVSRLAQNIYARLDRATTLVEMRTLSMEAQIEQVLGQEAVTAQLAERRRRLALPAQPAA